MSINDLNISFDRVNILERFVLFWKIQCDSSFDQLAELLRPVNFPDIQLSFRVRKLSDCQWQRRTARDSLLVGKQFCVFTYQHVVSSPVPNLNAVVRHSRQSDQMFSFRERQTDVNTFFFAWKSSKLSWSQKI